MLDTGRLLSWAAAEHFKLVRSGILYTHMLRLRHMAVPASTHSAWQHPNNTWRCTRGYELQQRHLVFLPSAHLALTMALVYPNTHT